MSINVLNLILNATVGFVATGTLGYLAHFAKEQRQVNKANALANRSMQRDVLFRYFHIVVEQGMPITTEEMEHIDRCYTAYHDNGGNGTGTLMYERIKATAKLDTGRA